MQFFEECSNGIFEMSEDWLVELSYAESSIG